MPEDIRNFFSGRGRTSIGGPREALEKAETPADASKKRRRGKRNVISDEEEDDSTHKKRSPGHVRAVRAPKSPVGEEVTTADYFSSKPLQSGSETKKSRTRQKAHPAIEIKYSPSKNSPSADTPESKSRAAQDKNSPSKTASSRSLGTNARSTRSKDDSNMHEPGCSRGNGREGETSGEDIFGAEFRGSTKALNGYETESGKSDAEVHTTKKENHRKRKPSALIDSDDDVPPDPKTSKNKSRTVKATPKKPRTPAKPKAVTEDAEIQKIFDSVPTVRAPTPPSQDKNKKFNFSNTARSQTAPNAGAKEIPQGAENCLAGLTFVFTGILDALGRDEGQELVKKHGGKVTTSPSSKTDYVVLGTEAGPKKLETIRKFNLKTINEDGLFALIRALPAHGGSGQAALKAGEKRQAEDTKIREEAERQENELAIQRKKASLSSNLGKRAANDLAQFDDQLWTAKYAPTQLNQICGNKTQVEKLQSWLRNWHKNAKISFKKGGPDGLGLYRAVMIHGNPGVGKTTAAHLVAQLGGYDVVETNASDTRSKRLVETGLKGVLDTTSLVGYFQPDGQKAEPSKRRLVLIMDEVDGMSAGDRGGVGAMASICKKTSIPIILICNERKQPKMKPFDHVTFDLPFRKPTTDQVRSRIMTILYREGISKIIPTNVVNALIEGSGADIRRTINMISTAKLDQQVMDYDEGKKMSNAWEKNIILKPWDITQKILGGGLFAPSSKATLNEKAELYFNDHDFSFLMLQENYLYTNPSLSLPFEGRKKALKVLDLVDKAAESISDGDLVDSMIHGAQQHWSLMPVHAIFSFVRPSSFVAGSTAGNRIQFTSWLGNNSKQGKLARFVKDIQAHMRLRASGDRHDIRQQYLPLLWSRLVKTLELHGSDLQCIESVIELMDSYFLTKDDWDAILELGVGPHDAGGVKLGTQVKSNFTRKYNAATHPLPFIKAGSSVPSAKSGQPKPDLEEAIEESDDEALVDPAAEEEDEELDLKKDKYVQVPKKRKVAPKKTNKGAETEENVSESEEPPSKKNKTKNNRAGKAPKGKSKK